MSVRGEFRRLVADVVACLQSDEGDDARALARSLEAERSLAAEDLLGSADRVLALWEVDGQELTPSDPEVRARLDDTAERMQQIARLVLGR